MEGQLINRRRKQAAEKWFLPLVKKFLKDVGHSNLRQNREQYSVNWSTTMQSAAIYKQNQAASFRDIHSPHYQIHTQSGHSLTQTIHVQKPSHPAVSLLFNACPVLRSKPQTALKFFSQLAPISEFFKYSSKKQFKFTSIQLVKITSHRNKSQYPS